MVARSSISLKSINSLALVCSTGAPVAVDCTTVHFPLRAKPDPIRPRNGAIIGVQRCVRAVGEPGAYGPLNAVEVLPHRYGAIALGAQEHFTLRRKRLRANHCRAAFGGSAARRAGLRDSAVGVGNPRASHRDDEYRGCRERQRHIAIHPVMVGRIPSSWLGLGKRDELIGFRCAS